MLFDVLPRVAVDFLLTKTSNRHWAVDWWSVNFRAHGSDWATWKGADLLDHV